MRTTHTPYRLRHQGFNLGHMVRFNQDHGCWQHMSPKSDYFHDTTRDVVHGMINNGATIVPYRPSQKRL